MRVDANCVLARQSSAWCHSIDPVSFGSDRVRVRLYRRAGTGSACSKRIHGAMLSSLGSPPICYYLWRGPLRLNATEYSRFPYLHSNPCAQPDSEPLQNQGKREEPKPTCLFLQVIYDRTAASRCSGTSSKKYFHRCLQAGTVATSLQQS